MLMIWNRVDNPQWSLNLVHKVDKKVKMNQHVMISSLSDEFLQILRSVLYEIITVCLNYWKLCSQYVPKMLTDAHKIERLGSSFTFLERYRVEGNVYLDWLVTGDGTWVAYVTQESKQQSISQLKTTRKIATNTFRYRLMRKKYTHENCLHMFLSLYYFLRQLFLNCKKSDWIRRQLLSPRIKSFNPGEQPTSCFSSLFIANTAEIPW